MMPNRLGTHRLARVENPRFRVAGESPTNRAVCAVELQVQHAHLQDSIVLCTMAHPIHPTSKAGGDPD